MSMTPALSAICVRRRRGHNPRSSQASRRHATVNSRPQEREAAGGGVRCFAMADCPLSSHSCTPNPTHPPHPYTPAPRTACTSHPILPLPCTPSPISFCLHLSHFLSFSSLFPSLTFSFPAFSSFLPSSLLPRFLSFRHYSFLFHFYTRGPLSTFSLPSSLCPPNWTSALS